ncbi:helix-turn-helix domain-containing protein [Methanonatronarchaeum sp. AMET-Sl]|uniref:TrmB family transcriptional regulator n=1 Tax=Methanonatronarchaeum sp. AMET-Sl TaxID=3037654 RepID=UPI00244E017D|nr:helix-turn-helix domain-containing protein [Methanonatronarchaeum sp. AMET-Sl]WGI17292.1 helix-turn-helix domain-containing protein [Methanonatronarchaeum sp. AMET-Sl]
MPDKKKIDRNDAINNLEELGLSNYEARTFIALNRLGRGTAREIYRVSDVPRSQIYGAAEELDKKGLVEIQRSKPMRFRPVELDEAEKKLQEDFESKKESALTYIKNVKSELFDTSEEKEDVWTIHGYETVNRRIRDIISESEDYIILSISEKHLFSNEILDEIKNKADEGVEINVLSHQDDLSQELTEIPNTEVIKPPESLKRKDMGGRVVVSDGDTALLSVLSENKEIQHPEYESAIWSRETGFSKVLVQLIENWLKEMIQK